MHSSGEARTARTAAAGTESWVAGRQPSRGRAEVAVVLLHVAPLGPEPICAACLDCGARLLRGDRGEGFREETDVRAAIVVAHFATARRPLAPSPRPTGFGCRRARAILTTRDACASSARLAMGPAASERRGKAEGGREISRSSVRSTLSP